ncbi:HPP family protein [Candidatus Uabimicrobium sp. HlEnr_7]|uniref:CBS domain-containing protein n=1 Tax=Candidatus Uabimicrobium helgolandensis TaxID=3095367 RepID=UPI0035586A30
MKKKDYKAKNIMSTQLILVQNTMTLFEASKVLIENKISGAPVVDHNKKLRGVISLRDLVKKERASIDENKVLKVDSSQFFIDSSFYFSLNDQIDEENLTVEDVMTPLTLYVNQNTPIEEIAILIVNTGVHRIFVQNEECLVGVISTIDILRFACEEGLFV